MLGLTVDQLGWAAAGFLLVFTVALAWSVSKRNALERGYDTGYHDRQHWETDKVVKGKLERP